MPQVDRAIPCAMRNPMRGAPLLQLGSLHSRWFSHRAWNGAIHLWHFVMIFLVIRRLLKNYLKSERADGEPNCISRPLHNTVKPKK